jgi:hypothetical protein
MLRLLYKARPFQRAQICEDWSLGTWRYAAKTQMPYSEKIHK